MNLLKSFQEVIDLLMFEDAWIKDTLAIDEFGEPTTPVYDDACQWCLAGAVEKVANCDTVVRDRMFETLVNELSDHFSIATFNDAEETTHTDVMNLLDKIVDDIKDGKIENVEFEGHPNNYNFV